MQIANTLSIYSYAFSSLDIAAVMPAISIKVPSIAYQVIMIPELFHFIVFSFPVALNLSFSCWWLRFNNWHLLLMSLQRISLPVIPIIFVRLFQLISIKLTSEFFFLIFSSYLISFWSDNMVEGRLIIQIPNIPWVILSKPRVIYPYCSSESSHHILWIYHLTLGGHSSNLSDILKACAI